MGGAPPKIEEADKPWYLTLILLGIFSGIVLGYSLYLSLKGLDEQLNSFIASIINIVVGWAGVGVGYYLRGKAA